MHVCFDHMLKLKFRSSNPVFQALLRLVFTNYALHLSILKYNIKYYKFIKYNII